MDPKKIIFRSVSKIFNTSAKPFFSCKNNTRI